MTGCAAGFGRGGVSCHTGELGFHDGRVRVACKLARRLGCMPELGSYALGPQHAIKQQRLALSGGRILVERGRSYGYSNMVATWGRSVTRQHENSAFHTINSPWTLLLRG